MQLPLWRILHYKLIISSSFIPQILLPHVVLKKLFKSWIFFSHIFLRINTIHADTFAGRDELSWITHIKECIMPAQNTNKGIGMINILSIILKRWWRVYKSRNDMHFYQLEVFEIKAAEIETKAIKCSVILLIMSQRCSFNFLDNAMSDVLLYDYKDVLLRMIHINVYLMIIIRILLMVAGACSLGACPGVTSRCW